jgi:hypothetical protein
VTVKKRSKKEAAPTIAPGLDDHEELEENASEEEIRRGQYTSVTHVSYDETDPS